MGTNNKSKKLFLIYGIAREINNWDNPIKKLEEAFPDFEIIPLDNKGVGEFHNMAAPLSINGNIDFLKQKFDKLKGEENYFLGWSLGGMIVTKWSQRYPEDMKKMILMTTSFGILSPFWKRLIAKNLPALISTIFSKGMKREENLFDFINNNKDIRKQLIDEALEIQKKRPVTGINVIRQVWAAFFYFYPSKKKHPTLVLGAKKDLLVDYSCSVKIYKKWDTPYEEHPWAGHDIMNDDTEWVIEKMKAFI